MNTIRLLPNDFRRQAKRINLSRSQNTCRLLYIGRLETHVFLRERNAIFEKKKKPVSSNSITVDRNKRSLCALRVGEYTEPRLAAGVMERDKRHRAGNVNVFKKGMATTIFVHYLVIWKEILKRKRRRVKTKRAYVNGNALFKIVCS